MSQESIQRSLYGLTAEQRNALVRELGHPGFRAKQLTSWLYEKGAASPEEMTNLPQSLRAALEQEFAMSHLQVQTEQQAKDGTLKRLYALADGQLIESVLMPYHDTRRTACISSQAGCAMGCTFCATGQMGFARHLTSAEIFEQAAIYSAHLKRQGERLSNVVFMGMGEPFHNYDNVLHAARRLMTDLGIGARHITISTVGVVPKIRAFAKEGLQITLAISLHAATDEERSRMLPVNRRYPIRDLMAACREYVAATRRRVTFEWALIDGKNDRREDARRLGQLLQGLLCHVNLIPLNPTKGYSGAPTEGTQAAQFVETLAEFGVSATLRVRRGIDIDAGCGQLRSKVAEKTRKSPEP